MNFRLSVCYLHRCILLEFGFYGKSQVSFSMVIEGPSITLVKAVTIADCRNGSDLQSVNEYGNGYKKLLMKKSQN